ncbi:hypothetical protein T265_08485 [Opisthorchis viverrini]|uniref:Uncharacterized protein n=1 Tax=Opisthorchis viverrini TaxID=6198 RepID=A0A074Z911_OPIVI|nr:hypothetical protein T265_08485 [Opisthorchis viverrini]KER23676.1 hypothetical protein T265_08485 [Opisthorchis viverrini]
MLHIRVIIRSQGNSIVPVTSWAIIPDVLNPKGTHQIGVLGRIGNVLRSFDGIVLPVPPYQWLETLSGMTQLRPQWRSCIQPIAFNSMLPSQFPHSAVHLQCCIYALIYQLPPLIRSYLPHLSELSVNESVAATITVRQVCGYYS